MKIEIHYLYVEDCVDCAHMLLCLEKAIKEVSPENIDLVSHSCDEDKNGNMKDEDALDIAIEHGFDDLPACVIGDETYCGKQSYDYGEILEATKKAWETVQ